MQVFPIRLELNSLDDLFVVAQRDPFQPNFRTMPGIEEVVQLLQAKAQHQTVALTLVLPSGTTMMPDMDMEMHNALIRYCSAQIKANRLEMEAKRSGAMRQFRFGLLFLAVALGVATAITRSVILADWLKDLLSNAVALWSPTDALLFGWYPNLKRIRIYTALQETKISMHIAPSTQ